MSSDEFAKIDFPSLTKAAESGDGCTVRAAITNLGYEERFQALHLIREENEKHRTSDPAIAKVWGFFTPPNPLGNLGDSYLSLVRYNSSSYLPEYLYSDVLHAQKGTHEDKCFPKPADKP